uniref:Putative deoxyribonuclease i n=1 Tax=Panstrongylus lignarius TaxID=156445 RepID=A0A224XR96_9HEMI
MTALMVWRQYHSLVTVLSTITFSVLVTGDCVFDVDQEVAYEPLLLQTVITSCKTTYQLFRSKECTLNIKSNENLLLACPGRENYLKSTNDTWNLAQCVRQSSVRINNEVSEYGQLECKTRPRASLKISGKLCFKNNGVVIHIGFEVNNNWYPLLEVCHNIQKSQTYYVKHNVILPTTHCNKTPNTRPFFTEGDTRLYTGLNMGHIYATRYQHAALKRMIGTNSTKYINRNENKFLARGHLAPNADFPIDAWHTLTFFYINCAPQWQSINAGIWASLENKVRKISLTMKQLNVITGTHGIMEIEGKKFYLGNQRVPVPEYFWKLLHNAADDSCMGFITKNDPFLKRQPQKICEDVCSRYNWKLPNHDVFHGYIYCCEYHRLSKVIEEVPNVRCRTALRFPQSF